MKNFVYYCHLVPVIVVSGGKHQNNSGNKDGNKYLKVAFNQAAIAAFSFHSPVNEFYKKEYRRSAKYNPDLGGHRNGHYCYFILPRNELCGLQRIPNTKGLLLKLASFDKPVIHKRVLSAIVIKYYLLDYTHSSANKRH